MARQQLVNLVCHDWTPPGPARAIEVDVRRQPDGALACHFRLHGALDRVRVPPLALPRFTMQLWEHTCFELFVAVDESPQYYEFNLAPSGCWAAFEFLRYREVEGLGDAALAPRIAVRTTPDRLELDATVALERLSAEYRTGALRVGLAAVVEASDGALSYWALKHPPGKPDFHHADAFALQVWCNAPSEVVRLAPSCSSESTGSSPSPRCASRWRAAAWRSWRTRPRSPAT